LRLIFFTIVFISCSTFVAATEKSTKEFLASQVKKIEIKNPKGEIELIGTKGAKKISVVFEKVQFEANCKFTQELSAGVLTLSVTHENSLFEKANCVSKILLSVPSSLPEVDVSTVTGNVKFQGVDSAVDFKTVTGNVEIKGDSLKAVSGKTATGAVSLSYQTCPKRADIDLISATGDADIQLGASCKIRVGLKSATGELFNEMGDSEDYQVLISMKTASGHLKVKKLVK